MHLTFLIVIYRILCTEVTHLYYHNYQQYWVDTVFQLVDCLMSFEQVYQVVNKYVWKESSFSYNPSCLS